MLNNKIRIGCRAGFSGDRIEPAIMLAEKSNLDYLVLECLAERTIALAQKRKLQDPTKGYDPLLERRIESLLPILVKNKVRLITNMGAANPIAAAKKVVEIAKKLGLRIKVAAVTSEGEISYAGKNALERAKLAGEIVKKRSPLTAEGGIFEELKIDYIGLNSVFRNNSIVDSHSLIVNQEIRLRVAAKAKKQEDAVFIGEEVEALYTNGPAGGGGVRKYVNEVIGIVSVLIDRTKVLPKITIFEAL